LAQRSSRKRRKERQRGATAGSGDNGAAMARGYARSRAKDDAVRAALEPLEPGERPTAVTVGAIVAAVATVANLVALAFGYDADKPRDTFTTLLGAVILVTIAVGMWRARYWAVLGMQTLLAITVILSSLALIAATNIWGAVLALMLIGGAGTLFWFLVKAMARIQMPERPGAH
jgi:hypothetical protein